MNKYKVHREDVYLKNEESLFGMIFKNNPLEDGTIIVTTKNVIVNCLDKDITYTDEDLLEMNLKDIICCVSEDKIGEYE